MIDEQTYEHQWVIGEWHRKDKWDRYKSRDDVCSLCGCERQMIKFKRKFKTIVAVATYSRSKQIFGEDNMPSCCGAKNPQ